MKGFFVFFGPPGSGKTTESLTTFQDSLYISSSPNNPHYYKQWLKTEEGMKSGLRPPKDEVVIDQYVRTANGKPIVDIDPTTKRPRPLSQKATMEAYVSMVVDTAYLALAQEAPPPWNYVVIDELGTFATRIFGEIAPTVVTRDGKPNPLGAYNVAGDWLAGITNTLRNLVNVNIGVCFVCHDQEPEIERDKKGGPKLFSQAAQRQVCADADGVMLRTLEDAVLDINNPTAQKAANRIWRVHASQHHLAKLRGIPDSMFEEIKPWPAKKILERAGFTV